MSDRHILSLLVHIHALSRLPDGNLVAAADGRITETSSAEFMLSAMSVFLFDCNALREVASWSTLMPLSTAT